MDTMIREDLAYIAWQDAEYVAWQRIHADALEEEAYQEWAETRRDDDEDDSRDAYVTWCEDQVPE